MQDKGDPHGATMRGQPSASPAPAHGSSPAWIFGPEWGVPLDLLSPQLLKGLATASSLFLVAAGLSIIFRVTWIVNLAEARFTCWALISR